MVTKFVLLLLACIIFITTNGHAEPHQDDPSNKPYHGRIHPLPHRHHSKLNHTRAPKTPHVNHSKKTNDAHALVLSRVHHPKKAHGAHAPDNFYAHALKKSHDHPHHGHDDDDHKKHHGHRGHDKNRDHDKKHHGHHVKKDHSKHTHWYNFLW